MRICLDLEAMNMIASNAALEYLTTGNMRIRYKTFIAPGGDVRCTIACEVLPHEINEGRRVLSVGVYAARDGKSTQQITIEALEKIVEVKDFSSLGVRYFDNYILSLLESLIEESGVAHLTAKPIKECPVQYRNEALRRLKYDKHGRFDSLEGLEGDELSTCEDPVHFFALPAWETRTCVDHKIWPGADSGAYKGVSIPTKTGRDYFYITRHDVESFEG